MFLRLMAVQSLFSFFFISLEKKKLSANIQFSEWVPAVL